MSISKTVKLPDGQKAVVLGSLGLQVDFTIPGDTTPYRTLTYPFSFVNIKQGTRDVTNMSTFRSQKMANRTLVIPVSQNIERIEK
jgi:hypothetical protein